MDYKKIVRGLVIAVAGAILTYVAETIPGIDFGTWTPVAVAVAAALVNAGREWLKSV